MFILILFDTQVNKQNNNTGDSRKIADTIKVNGKSTSKAATNPSKRPIKTDDVFKIGIVDRYPRKTWQFPETLRCVFGRCGKVSSTRNEAVEHFRVVHAEGAMWCNHCNSILSSKDPAKYVTRHFQKLHPHVGLSTSWKLKLVSMTLFFDAYLIGSTIAIIFK